MTLRNLCVVLEVFALSMAPQTQAQGGLPIRNMGAGHACFHKDWMVYSVHEPFASEDLNGDGDRLDTVFHVENLKTGETRNVGLATGFRWSLSGDEDWLVLSVYEPAGNEDLNGDGDTIDDVFHLYNLGTDESTNLRLAAGQVRCVSGDYLVLNISEDIQGFDLNGDGDAEDGIVHVHNLERGETVNLRLAASVRGVYGDALVFRVFEDRQRLALNGDGDTGGTTDAVYILSYFFLGSERPRGPFPTCDLGVVRADRDLECEIQLVCD